MKKSKKYQNKILWEKPKLTKLSFRDTYSGTDDYAPEASGPATYS